MVPISGFVFDVDAFRDFGGREIPIVTVQPSAVDHPLDTAVDRLDVRHAGEPAVGAELGLQQPYNLQVPLRHATPLLKGLFHLSPATLDPRKISVPRRAVNRAGLPAF